jgi:hypothetical protein
MSRRQALNAPARQVSCEPVQPSQESAMNDMLRHSLLATILGASLIAATVQAADTTQTVVISARALPPTARLLETPLPPEIGRAHV